MARSRVGEIETRETCTHAAEEETVGEPRPGGAPTAAPAALAPAARCGCGSSGGLGRKSQPPPPPPRKLSALDERVLAALRQRRAAHRGSMTMNKILLKMTDVHAGFAAIRRTFEAIDVDGSGEIDTLEFEAAVTCLQIKVPNGMDASSLFHASDLTQDGKLGFKEFLIASMLCHLLAADASSSQVCMAENLPVKEQSSPVPSPGSTHHSSPMPSPGGTPGTPKRSTVVPHGDEDERRAADAAAAAVAKKAFLASKKHFSASAFAKAATVVADAWIVCDLDMDGFITKSELRQALGGGATPQDAAKGQSSKNGADVDGLALLRTRFDEMDFDRSGLISCQEFFYAFNSWLDDPDEEDE